MANVVLGRGGVPPIDELPGVEVGPDAVAAASGDQRDWFLYQERLDAYNEMRERFETAYRRNRKRDRMPSSLEFGQIMVAGMQGAGKSVLVGAEGIHYAIKGHPFFHTGESWLFGRSLMGAERYEVLRRAPLYSVFAYDEAHTTFESGLSNSTGTRGWRIQSAGYRKKNARLYMPTAKVSMVAPGVREGASHVWRPAKVTIRRRKKDDERDYNDPRNFVMVWESWGNYPFQRADIIDGAPERDKRYAGLGASDDVFMRYGEVVRLAMLLTDTFQPVESAAAMQYALKDPMEAQRAAESAGVGGGSLSEEQSRILHLLHQLTRQEEPPEIVRPAALGYRTGVPEHIARQVMTQFFGNTRAFVKSERGYALDVVAEEMALMFNFEDEE